MQDGRKAAYRVLHNGPQWHWQVHAVENCERHARTCDRWFLSEALWCRVQGQESTALAVRGTLRAPKLRYVTWQPSGLDSNHRESHGAARHGEARSGSLPGAV